MGKVKTTVLNIQEVLLCAARKWWRPIFAFTAIAILFVNGLLIPLVTWTVADLTGLSLLVGAVSALYVARTYEITRGRTDETADATALAQSPPPAGGEQG